MPVALGILVLIGLLVGFWFQQVRSNNTLAFKNHREAQRLLMVASALAYAQKFIPSLNETNSVYKETRVVLDTSGIGYRMVVRPWGTLLRLEITPFMGKDSSKTWDFEVGAAIPSDSLPQIGITGGGGVTLESTASLTGIVWCKGLVKQSKGGSAPGVTVDPNKDRAMQAWRLPLKLESEWLESAKACFRTRNPLCGGLAVMSDSGALKVLDGGISNTQIYADSVFIQGLIGENLVILARRARFNGTNSCKNCLIQAFQDLSIEGNLHWTGQILAVDSAVVEMQDSLTGNPIVVVQGDSSAVTHKKMATLRVEKGILNGWWGTGSEIGYQQERMEKVVLQKRVQLSGVLSSGSLVLPKGVLRGHLLASGVARFDSRSVLWEGGIDSVSIAPNGQEPQQIVFPWLPGRPIVPRTIGIGAIQ